MQELPCIPLHPYYDSLLFDIHLRPAPSTIFRPMLMFWYVIHAIVTSRFVFCNSLYRGLPWRLIQKLQLGSLQGYCQQHTFDLCFESSTGSRLSTGTGSGLFVFLPWRSKWSESNVYEGPPLLICSGGKKLLEIPGPKSTQLSSAWWSSLLNDIWVLQDFL